MIQRIQSLYLLIAGGLNIALLFLPPIAVFSSQLSQIAFPICAFVMAHLLFVAILLFKYRAKQQQLIYGNFILTAVFYIALLIIFPMSTLAFSAAFPLVSLPFSYLALRAIKKDEQLIRSLDRIR